MKLTRSRLNKIINCKVQTKKRHMITTNTLRTNANANANANANTKKHKSKYFNLRNNTVKNWIRN
jgi:hypothetical protein